MVEIFMLLRVGRMYFTLLIQRLVNYPSSDVVGRYDRYNSPVEVGDIICFMYAFESLLKM